MDVPSGDDTPSSAALNPGCDAATQNRIELTCGQLTSKSSDACKDAYSKCLPAIAEAIVEGLPYAGCTKGKCGIVKIIMGSRELEWSANGAPAEKFCCPKKQDEPSGCESHEPVFQGGCCCVKNEGKDKCSSFSYNGHPKLEYLTLSARAGILFRKFIAAPMILPLVQGCNRMQRRLLQQSLALGEQAEKRPKKRQQRSSQTMHRRQIGSEKGSTSQESCREGRERTTQERSEGEKRGRAGQSPIESPRGQGSC